MSIISLKNILSEEDFIQRIKTSLLEGFGLESELLVKFACERNYHLGIKFLIENDFNINDNYLLHYTIKNNLIHLTRMLIKFGTDTNSNWYYALNLASYYGNLEIVELLINNGADVQYNNKCEAKVIFLKSSLYYELNISGDKTNFILLHAVKGGNYKIIQLLINMGVRVDEFAIICALICANMDIFRLLISNCDDIKSVGNSIILRAIVYGRLDIIKLLINTGVNIDSNAIDAAALHGEVDIMEFFISICNKENYADALEYSLRRGHLSVFKLLIEHCNYVEVDKLLIKASISGHVSIAKFLIEIGADIAYDDFKAFKLATKYQNCKLIKLFVDMSPLLRNN